MSPCPLARLLQSPLICANINNKMTIKIIIVLLAIASALSVSAEEPNISHLVAVGQTKEEIKQILSDPYEKKAFVKSNRPIWGPEEEFWDKIPEGTHVEVWRYKSEKGHLNLYFLGNDNHLAYKAFAPSGIVYEPAR